MHFYCPFKRYCALYKISITNLKPKLFDLLTLYNVTAIELKTYAPLYLNY